jgi:hypothetical protein
MLVIVDAASVDADADDAVVGLLGLHIWITRIENTQPERYLEHSFQNKVAHFATALFISPSLQPSLRLPTTHFTFHSMLIKLYPFPPSLLFQDSILLIAWNGMDGCCMERAIHIESINCSFFEQKNCWKGLLQTIR